MSVGKLPSRDQAIAESDHAGGDQTDSSVYSQVADLVTRTRDDWRWAWEYFIYSRSPVVGTPRSSTAIFSLAGIDRVPTAAPTFVLARQPKELDHRVRRLYESWRVCRGNRAGRHWQRLRHRRWKR